MTAYVIRYMIFKKMIKYENLKYNILVFV